MCARRSSQSTSVLSFFFLFNRKNQRYAKRVRSVRLFKRRTVISASRYLFFLHDDYFCFSQTIVIIFSYSFEGSSFRTEAGDISRTCDRSRQHTHMKYNWTHGWSGGRRAAPLRPALVRTEEDGSAMSIKRGTDGSAFRERASRSPMWLSLRAHGLEHDAA